MFQNFIDLVSKAFVHDREVMSKFELNKMTELLRRVFLLEINGPNNGVIVSSSVGNIGMAFNFDNLGTNNTNINSQKYNDASDMQLLKDENEDMKREIASIKATNDSKIVKFGALGF